MNFISSRSALFLLSIATLFCGVLHAEAATFSRSLSIGSTGSDVVALQKLLNVLPTGYFGPLTARAVAQFQEKNAAEVLLPQGLSRGTGMVGPATLRILNRQISSASQAIAASPAPVSIPSLPPVTQIQPQKGTVVPTQGPNTKNLDKFIDSMASVSAKQGLSQAQIDTLKAEIIKQATGTTTDFHKQFVESIKAKAAAERAAKSSLALAVDSLVQAGRKFIGLKEAEAGVDLPFGGELYYTFPCYCSGTVYITVSPLPPSYISTLTYTPFSQAYLSYNIPYTEWLLGKYTPGVARCLIPATPCYLVPAEGQVGSTVGSSAF